MNNLSLNTLTMVGVKSSVISPWKCITKIEDTRYKNFSHSPMRGKGKRSVVADRSMASPTYNKNMSIGISDY